MESARFFGAKECELRVIKSIAMAYEAKQDRLLVAINPGRREVWSCWLTRKMVLSLLDQIPAFIERTSSLAQHTPTDLRGELIEFEREAAVANTKKAMTRTDQQVMKDVAATATLADRLLISNYADRFKLEVFDAPEGQAAAAGVFGRAELQRVVQMVETEVARCGWLPVSAMTADVADRQSSAKKRVRH